MFYSSLSAYGFLRPALIVFNIKIPHPIYGMYIRERRNLKGTKTKILGSLQDRFFINF